MGRGRSTRSRSATRSGQPVLVGTISVEVSELLSEQPGQARHPARGPQRQARARRARGRDRRRGRPARRGHHRHQHGGPRRRHQARRQPRAPDPARAAQARPQARRPRLRRALRRDPARRSRQRVEADREKVLEAGGLFICGTERHESRRIDNQLRGRAGRQGDPGESRFFLSRRGRPRAPLRRRPDLQDPRPLGTVDEDGNEEPIEAGMLSKQIEKAQKKVEEQNFLIRKRVLEYDDVMNEQRRDRLRVPRRGARGPRHGRRRARGDRRRHPPRGRRVHASATSSRTGTSTACSPRSTTSSRSSFGAGATSTALNEREELVELLADDALRLYDAREEELGEELMRALERYLLLQIIDNSAGASTSTTWTTCARASTCAGSPRSIRSSPTRTRPSSSSPT